MHHDNISIATGFGTVGEADICEKCNKIKIRPKCRKIIGWMRESFLNDEIDESLSPDLDSFFLFERRGDFLPHEEEDLPDKEDVPDYNIYQDCEKETPIPLSVEDAPDGVYVVNYGICQECIEKYHYHILSDTEDGLVWSYPQRAEHFGGAGKYIEKIIEQFFANLSKNFLEKLNPTAFQRYCREYDAMPDARLLSESRYVDEIKPDIIAWIQKETELRFGVSRKRNNKRLSLLEEEKKVKQFLAETKTCGGYCDSYPFSQLMIRDGARPAQKLKDLCEGRQLTAVDIYPTIEGLREDLQRMVYDPRYSVDVNETVITELYEFQELLKGLPKWIAENKVFQ